MNPGRLSVQSWGMVTSPLLTENLPGTGDVSAIPGYCF